MKESGAARQTGVVAVLIGVVTLAVYWRVRGHGFIIFDDPEYVSLNRIVQGGLTWEGVKWAFTTNHMSNWHPITWLSHMADCSLFGLNPGAHHLVSAAMHAVDAVLLFLLFQRVTGAPWRSAFVAAFFAWHPLHVESVAWVAERKDVLSMLFMILSIWAYVRYVEKPGAWRYGLTLAALGLGLMAKPMLVTLPCVFLLLDLWPLRRLQFANRAGAVSDAPGVSIVKLAVEKLPFLGMVAACATATFFAQRAGGAVASLQGIPLSERTSNAVVSCLDYLVKMIWPANLSVFYPRDGAFSMWKVATAALVLGGVTALAVRWLRSRPYFAVGWFWYLGTLVPVIGLVQVGDQAMADRYTYVPLIGISIMLAWGMAEVVERRREWTAPVQAGAVTLAVVWIVCTGQQLRYWTSNATLFTHARAVTSNNYVADTVVGKMLLAEGRPAEARQCFAAALAFRPTYAQAHFGLGNVFAAEKRYEEAIACYREALRFFPNLPDVHNAWGVSLMLLNRPGEALDQFAAAVRLDPSLAEARFNWALTLLRLGRPDEAVAGFQRVLEWQPGNQPARLELGQALVAAHRVSEGLACFQGVLQRNPNSVEALNQVAWILSTHKDSRLRNGQEAVFLAARACELTQWKSAASLSALAAAYAEVGRFDDAVATAEKGIAQATASGDKEKASLLERLLPLYKTHTPYREP